MVSASWGRGAFAACCAAELCFGASAGSALVKSGVQDAAETVLSAEERNLRRFTVITSEKRIQPIAR